MQSVFLSCCLAAVFFLVSGTTYFADDFSSNSPFDKWTTSTWKGAEMGEWQHTAGDWPVDAADKGIQVTEDMKFHAISAKMDTPLNNKDQDLVLQFTVKHEKKSYSFCGGGYIKLLPPSDSFDPVKFGGSSPYNIMFGPDLCGHDVSRIHAIFTDKGGKNLLKTEDIKLEYDDKNEFTHVYTLIVSPDHTFKVLFDNKEKASGKIEDGWDFPKELIDDESDTKPADWVDEKQIPDPEDKKPEGWEDIPETIAEPGAVQPEEWDDDMDGEWEAPQVPNPEFKGEWEPKMIDNPEYKGEWKPKQVPNPEYYSDIAVYETAHVGFELWTVNNGSIFDNILITDNVEEASAAADAIIKAVEGEKDVKTAWEEANKGSSSTNDSDDDDQVEEADDEEEAEAAPTKDEL